MKYCSECGFENPDEAKFCRNCGHDLNEVSQKQVTSNITEVKKQEVTSNVTVNKNMNSIVSKIFYKTDKYTGELRIAKAKSISVAVFFMMFMFGIVQGSATASFAAVFIAAIIIGFIFAVPTFVICYLLGWAVDKITH